MGEYISLDVNLDKAEVALMRAQKLYDAVRRDEIALLGTGGQAGVGPNIPGGRVSAPDEYMGESPDAGTFYTDRRRGLKEPQSTFQKWENRWGKIEGFGRRAMASPVETTMSAIGGVPVVGPTAKASWEVGKAFADLGAPALKGILKALLPEALKEMGLPPEVSRKILDTAVDAAGMPQGIVNRMRNWDEAFQPTIQTMKDIVKLRTRAGGTVNADNLSKMYDFLFDYNKAETSMRRKQEQMGMERLWEGIAKSVERSLHN